MPDQADIYPKATAFIVDFAHSLLPSAEIVFTHGHLKVASEVKHFAVPFTRKDLEDLEPVLDGGLPTKYSDGMKSAIQWQIYLAFFHHGMIPNIKLSNVMLEEKRDWTNATLTGTHFEDETAVRLYRGLLTLESYLGETLQKHGEIHGVHRELDLIRNLTAWYQDNKHLHLGMIDGEVLSLLKGAAVLAMRELEDKKGTSRAKRVRDVYDADILSIAQEFTSSPYDRTKLPAVLYDYLADGIPTTSATARSKEADMTVNVGGATSRVQSPPGAIVNSGPISAFVSYKWGSEEHNEWVKRLAGDLRHGGVDALLDRWEVRFGDSFIDYMASAISRVGVVLFVVTDSSANSVMRGLGEGDAISFEMQLAASRKISDRAFRLIGVYREGNSLPAHLFGQRYIDFRQDDAYFSSLAALVQDLLGVSDKPPIGGRSYRKLLDEIASTEERLSGWRRECDRLLATEEGRIRGRDRIDNYSRLIEEHEDNRKVLIARLQEEGQR